jgi:acyl-coenzyme A thioesterase PaaI-like protein
VVTERPFVETDSTSAQSIATPAAREFDALPAPGDMVKSELSRLLGMDCIETLDVRDGHLRSRMPVTEGARGGFSAVFSGTFACWVDATATAVVAAGKPRDEAVDLLERVRTQSLSVEIVGNTEGPYVDLETRVDAWRGNLVFVTVAIADSEGVPLAVGKARLSFTKRTEQ